MCSANTVVCKKKHVDGLNRWSVNRATPCWNLFWVFFRNTRDSTMLQTTGPGAPTVPFYIEVQKSEGNTSARNTKFVWTLIEHQLCPWEIVEDAWAHFAKWALYEWQNDLCYDKIWVNVIIRHKPSCGRWCVVFPLAASHSFNVNL